MVTMLEAHTEGCHGNWRPSVHLYPAIKAAALIHLPGCLAFSTSNVSTHNSDMVPSNTEPEPITVVQDTNVDTVTPMDNTPQS